MGIVSALQGRPFLPGTPEFGEAFETFLMHELACHGDYVSGAPLSFWRSTSGFEVDFIIGDHTAVEVKAKENVSPSASTTSMRRTCGVMWAVCGRPD